MSDGAPFHDTHPAASTWPHDGMSAHEDHDAVWLGMFHQLVMYEIQNGHCLVPKRDRRHPKLSAWLEKQVTLFHRGRLSVVKQRELESLGMEWEVEDDRKSQKRHRAARWKERFAELVAFQKKHGHLRVTLKNQSSAGMMHWRDNQRIRFRNGVMPPSQKAKLESVGFEWENPARLSPSMEVHNVELWESMFAKLLAYREEHGHCQVPNSKQADAMLAKWVQRQRHHHKNNTIQPERRQRLEEIGFDWKSDKLHFASGWERRFAELLAFRERHGHLRVTKSNELSRGMSHWLDNQRLRRRGGTMKPEQKSKLDEIGFEWERQGTHNPALDEHHVAHWNGMFARLEAFKETQGHFHVPKGWREDPALARWLQNQRRNYRKGSGVGGLLPERLVRLDALGTEWRESPPPQVRRHHGSFVPQDPMAIWESRYSKLVEFHRLNGHANVPGRPDRLFRKWVLEQRKKHEEGSLEADQITRLEALGFSWVTPNPRPAAPPVQRERGPSIWDLRFAELQAFVAEHGHFRVPKKKDEFKTLRLWVVAQRVYRRSGSLSPAHQEKLEALGFPWEPGQGSWQGQLSQSWEDHLRELAAYKERTGHTRVPHHRGADKKLGGWVVRQRFLNRQGRLPPDRVRQLDAVGMYWNPARGRGGQFQPRGGSRSTDQRMAELREFHAQHGHANVPTKYPPNQLLGNWVSNTRIARKKGQLSAKRIQELDALGFLWRGERNNSPIRLANWEESFAALLEFQRVHGHVNVRSTDTGHPSLAAWVISQRVKHRRGTLPTDRVQKLESIGFQWGKAEYQPGSQKSWDQRFADLVAFRRRCGHPHVSKADKAHHSLDIWAKTQRMFYHQGKLSADQIQKLESISFTWDGKEGWWERQFRRWEAATQRRRTRHLTAIGDEDDDLAKWEQTQRNLHRRGQLSAEKASLLTRAGLIFEVPPPSKSRPQVPHQKLHPQP